MSKKRDIARDAAGAEQALLGSLMLDGGQSLHRAANIRGDMFSSVRHAEIFGAIASIVTAKGSADAVTVGQMISPGSLSYLIQITNDAPGLANLEAYADLVAKFWRLRQAMHIAIELRAQIEAGEDAGIDSAVARLMDLSKVDAQAEWSVTDALRLAYDHLEFAIQHPGELRGITTGIADLDEKLGGLHPGDLIIIGARASMGKTSAMLSMMAAGCLANPVGVISAEQPAVQIAQRMLSQASSVAAMKLRNGNISDEEWPKITAGLQSLMSRNAWIYDRSAPDIAEVARIARKWQHKHQIKALYVDYLQRLEVGRGSDAPKHERVGEIARSLKNLARDLNIPVVALAQVSRAVEQRADKRPHMGDLSDSSEIEKEADQILMLYRDEVYDPESRDKGTAEINVDKNRHGPTGFIRVAWLEETMRFADLAPKERQWP